MISVCHRSVQNVENSNLCMEIDEVDTSSDFSRLIDQIGDDPTHLIIKQKPLHIHMNNEYSFVYKEKQNDDEILSHSPNHTHNKHYNIMFI